MTHHDEKTGMASGGFCNSLQKIESIDGELHHNDCYKLSEHLSGGLIPKLMFCLLCRDQTEDAYSKIGSIRAENAMDLALLVNFHVDQKY